MLSSAVIGEAISESRKESLKAFSPWYLVKTCENHLPVSGKNL